MSLYDDAFEREVIGGTLTCANPNSSSTNQYFGRTVCNSIAGGISATITAPLVAADTLILMTPEVSSVADRPAFDLSVTGRVPGTGFTIRNVNSFSFVGSLTVTANWMLVNAGSFPG